MRTAAGPRRRHFCQPDPAQPPEVRERLLEPGDGVFAHYDEPHRAYHTLHPLVECFAALDPASTLAERLPEIEIATWFHDVIYDPRSEDNEERSAEFARASLLEAGAAPDVADRVRSMVLATKHGPPPPDSDARLLVDADLSLLGAEPRRFAEYEGQIRSEYAWVPAGDFRPARSRVLRGFLDRESIYATEWFRERLEQQARENIQGAVRRLST